MNEQTNTEAYTPEEIGTIKEYAKEYLYNGDIETPKTPQELKSMVDAFIKSVVTMATPIGMTKGKLEFQAMIESEINKSLQSFFNYFSLLLGESDYTNEQLTIQLAKRIELTKSEIFMLKNSMIHLEHYNSGNPELDQKNKLNIESVRKKLQDNLL